MTWVFMTVDTASFWTTTEYRNVAVMPVRDVLIEPLPIPKKVNQMKSVTSEDGSRVYEYDGKQYPSITTILKETDDEAKKALREWRNRIGVAEAEAFTRKAATRGTSWHSFCENFLLGKPIWSYIDTPEKASEARVVATMLNDKIECVLGLEGAVVSNEYGLAGRFDLCARLRDGRKAIIDFKTGTKLKYGNRLNGYALQSTFYADALNELLPPPKGVEGVDTIVIAQLLPKVCYWQESSTDFWRNMLIQRVNLFEERFKK